jgi:hypothetical protein
MARKTTKTARHRYLVQRFELWGNAKDGFDTNNVFTLETLETIEPLSMRYLLRMARENMTGYSFAWSENKSRPMSREGIELNDFGSEGYLDITYRGHIVGQVQHIGLCEHCGVESFMHWHKTCDELLKHRHGIAVTVFETGG